MNPSPVVVGLGELLWDCFADSRRPGGAPANVAFHAAQLGCRGVVCSRVGCDPLGDELIAFLARHGLATDAVQRDPRRPTGTVTVETSQADNPRFTIHENAAWDHLAFDAQLAEVMAAADAVCFGTLVQRGDDSRAAVHRALAAARPECLVVYDVNLRQHWHRREWIEQSLRACRVAKLNEHEVQHLSAILELGEATPFRFARALQGCYGVETVCITRAERGCLLLGDGQQIDLPGVKVEVADAVGAGDAFTAGLIFARLSGWPLAAQAGLANRVGALVASRSGAMPELRAEMAELVRTLGV